jgi:hypothetical protein
MFDHRIADPISRLGAVRDRPCEQTCFDRIEAGRERHPRGRSDSRASRPPRRLPVGSGDNAEAAPSVGSTLDVTV